MSSSRSSSRRNQSAVFPSLPIGVQNGLTCLVSDNQNTVAEMLEISSTTTSETAVEQLTERCAKVMKQQQLSAEQFLARFFHATVLSNHISTYYPTKSGKGTSAQVAERIANQWAKNSTISKSVLVGVAVKKDASLNPPHIPVEGAAVCTEEVETPEGVLVVPSKSARNVALETRHEHQQQSETLNLPTATTTTVASKLTSRKTDRQERSTTWTQRTKRRRSSS